MFELSDTPPIVRALAVISTLAVVAVTVPHATGRGLLAVIAFPLLGLAMVLFPRIFQVFLRAEQDTPRTALRVAGWVFIAAPILVFAL